MHFSVAVARLTIAIAYIALYKALGGGCELSQDVPPIAKPLLAKHRFDFPGNMEWLTKSSAADQRRTPMAAKSS